MITMAYENGTIEQSIDYIKKFGSEDFDPLG